MPISTTKIEKCHNRALAALQKKHPGESMSLRRISRETGIHKETLQDVYATAIAKLNVALRASNLSVKLMS